jgi:tetratricopeptide (TPR) repeat protein
MNQQPNTTRIGAVLILALALLAGLVKWAGEPREVSRMDHQRQMQEREVRQRFEQGVVMLHARQYDHAITALHRVLELAPRMPEAHVNMGYALLGLEQPDAARGFFEAAIALNPRQANAYYGLAVAEEARQDYEGALGAMRTYLHFARPDDPFRNKARSALWEWEDKLGRHQAPPAAAAAAPAHPPAPARP